MNVSEIIRHFEDGVRYECGCEERGLHPAIIAALEEGRVRAAGLLRCPVHRLPLALPPEVRPGVAV